MKRSRLALLLRHSPQATVAEGPSLLGCKTRPQARRGPLSLTAWPWSLPAQAQQEPASRFKRGPPPALRAPQPERESGRKRDLCHHVTRPNLVLLHLPGQEDTTTPATECNPAGPKARVNCGYPGISEKDCTEKGCCFDSAIPQVVWCYQPEIQAVERDCGAITPKKRVNCGPPGVTPDQCRENGCCFDSSVAGVPWCFKPEVKKETIQCAVLPKLRVNCGHNGIDMDQCYQKGCCFDSSDPHAPWCFYPDITDVTIIE